MDPWEAFDRLPKRIKDYLNFEAMYGNWSAAWCLKQLKAGKSETSIIKAIKRWDMLAASEDRWKVWGFDPPSLEELGL